MIPVVVCALLSAAECGGSVDDGAARDAATRVTAPRARKVDAGAVRDRSWRATTARWGKLDVRAVVPVRDRSRQTRSVIDAGTPDPFGPRKGGPPELAEPANVRVESTLSASPTFDAGYGAATLPGEVALPTFHVHVFASEELGPDALRKLSRPSVTLWLDTNTNMLRESTLDVLRSGGTSFVKLKAPVLDAHQKRFTTLRSGAWLDASELEKIPMHWVGARPVAIELSGEGSAAQWTAIARAKPAVLFWARPGCSALSWTAARALKARVITVEAEPCAHSGPPVIASFRGAAPSTERGPFVWIRPDAAPAQVRDLYVKNAATQLLVSVGDRAADVRKLSALLDAVERKR